MVKQPGRAKVSQPGGISATEIAAGWDVCKHKPRQSPAAGLPRRGAQRAGLSGPRPRAKEDLLCANHEQLDGKAAKMLPGKLPRVGDGVKRRGETRSSRGSLAVCTGHGGWSDGRLNPSESPIFAGILPRMAG